MEGYSVSEEALRNVESIRQKLLLSRYIVQLIQNNRVK